MEYCGFSVSDLNLLILFMMSRLDQCKNNRGSSYKLEPARRIVEYAY